MPGAGQLRERITLQRRTADANGDLLGPWADIATVSARVVPRTRGETALQQRIQGHQPVEATIRLTSQTRDVTNAWRFLWRGQAHDIQAVAPDERRTFLTILAEEESKP